MAEKLIVLLINTIHVSCTFFFQAAGLATMISTMRPDIDNMDEYVRNTTARAFAVVASALGIPSLLPFLKAVCKSKKSWQARHTGIKIVQQIAILMGCAILPHLRSLVEIIEHGKFCLPWLRFFSFFWSLEFVFCVVVRQKDIKGLVLYVLLTLVNNSGASERGIVV